MSIPCPAVAGENGDFPGIDPISRRPAQTVSAHDTAPNITPNTEIKEQLLQVDIDQQQLNETVLVLEDKAGALYLSGRDLQRWRFHSPDAGKAIAHDGEDYYPLSAIHGLSHVYDPARLTLMIEVRPEAFVDTTRSTLHEKISPPVKSGSGGFINYDLFAAHAPGATLRAGQFELAYFNRFGVGTSNVLAESLNNQSKVTRLDSTWTTDFPEKLQTLRLGDAITRPGTWGRATRFGGIQFATNFATQPGFDTFPLQSAVGQAVLPSTVDVFVNNALVSRQSVPPGPFSIRNIPVVTGAGTVQVVVRDLFGREQILSRPFYASQSLLRKGLQDFSAELGMVRENFGINSDDYAGWLGSGTYRRGLTEHLTGEIHGEAMRNQMTLGAGGDYLIPQLGTVNTYLAGSQSDDKRGGTALLGIDRLAQPWTLGARTQWTSRDFTQIGGQRWQLQQLPPIQSSSVNLGYSARAAGSVGAAYVMQRYRDRADTRLATLSYSLSLGKIGAISVSAIRIFSGEASTMIFAMLSIPLGSSTSMSVSAQSTRDTHGGRSDLATTLQRNLPLGDGYGYQLQARTDGSAEATYALQNSVGTYTIGAAQAQGATATRLNVSGGVALLGGDIFPSRRIDQSFAIARIPDYPGIGVLADNQPAGKTDASGNALIPRLRAYDRNVISIDQRDLPLDAEISTLKLEVIPFFRSGVDVRFPVRHSRGATLTLLLEDGKPVPVGASIQEIGKAQIHTVGYGGEVYVVGLGERTRLRATWGERRCEIDVLFTPGADPLPDLGTFICREAIP